jgi:predicted metalloprotease
VRWTILVLLLALALGGCTIEVVPNGRAADGTGQSAGEPDAPSGTLPATAGSPDTVDARPAAGGVESREVDEQRAVAVVDEFWRRWFAQEGRQYRSPRVVGAYQGSRGPRCAGEPAVPGNAFYCPPGDFLAWDDALMAAGYEQIGDAWVYLVIAHEWAHAIQARLRPSQVSQATELQADCLAGAALQGAAREGLVQIEPGDAEEMTRTLVVVADDFPWTDSGSHGNAQQRTAAFNAGVDGGVGACL